MPESGMTIRRAVPDITTADPVASSGFYQLLGFREEMNLGWVVNLVSPSNPTAQVILITKDAAASVNPDLSVEIDDVDAVYEAVRATGANKLQTLIYAVAPQAMPVIAYYVRWMAAGDSRWHARSIRTAWCSTSICRKWMGWRSSVESWQCSRNCRSSSTQPIPLTKTAS